MEREGLETGKGGEGMKGTPQIFTWIDATGRSQPIAYCECWPNVTKIRAAVGRGLANADTARRVS